jgi:uncharacterized protein YbbK (DUF523 family)
MEKILISACMLGISCRYDGKSKLSVNADELIALNEKYQLVPFCPEIYGGLPTPRVPSERLGEEVYMKNGKRVTDNFKKGAYEALELCRKLGIKKAILKAKSPSCGKGEIYDGSFSGSLKEGNGVCAELLLNNGISVYTENEILGLI